MRSVKIKDLENMIGQETGVSDWLAVYQDRVDQFADVTEDHQFIHVDVEKAKKTPFETTIAHGFLSLSFLSKFAEQCSLNIEDIAMGLNYGFDKVRFLNPVKTGSKIRGRFVLKGLIEKNPSQYLLTYSVIVEIKDETKPALVADWLVMQVVN